MNIIIISEEDKVEKNIYKLTDSRFIHVKKILKAEEGDILEIGLLNGPIARAKINSISDDRLILELAEFILTKGEKVRVDLICALPRPQTLKKILNYCGTMGIRNLFLIRSEKVEKSYFHSPLLNKENYSKFLIDGLSQGKRTNLPVVHIHNKFRDFFENQFQNNENDSKLFLADQQTEFFLEKGDLSKAKYITIVIGPEGGWNSFELNLIEEKGFKRIKLSNNTLRVENAVNAALAQIELLLSH